MSPRCVRIRLHDVKETDERLVDFQEDDKTFEVRLSDESFETYELDPPPYTLDTSKRELKRMYYDMVSIRYIIPLYIN